MIRRLLAVLIVTTGLGGLILYSQMRPQPNRVSGFVESDEIRLGSRIGGRVQAVHVQEGERVARGQVLVELEPFDLLQREQEAISHLTALDAEYRKFAAGLRSEEVAQAKARYDQFKARLELLEAGPRDQEIKVARAQLQAAEAELTLAQQEFRRHEELLARNAIARGAFDAVSERQDAARANVDMRKQELELLEIGTRPEEIREARAKVEEAHAAWQLAASGYRPEEIEQAKAARDAAEAALDVIREQKKELSIVSPVDGVVEALDLQAGDLAPASGPILSVMDESRLWVRAYAPENRVGLRVGQRLWVTVDPLGDQRLLGEITFIARQAEFTPNNVQTPEERAKQVFRIKVELPANSHGARPGMTADVWLDPVSDAL